MPGVTGESLALYAALQAQSQAAAGVRFVGVHFPGINRSDYLGLHPQARQRSYFMQPALRAGLQSGRVELLPLDYPGIFRDLSDQLSIDVAFAQVAPPDRDGSCSLGICADFIAAVWSRARRRIALINPRLPTTRGSFFIRAAECSALVDAEADVLAYEAGEPDDVTRARAALVASLVRDGDTIEFGVGKLQAAIFDALTGYRNLKIWSGGVSHHILPLLDRGIIDGEAAVQVGSALGNTTFYARVGRDDRFYFRPVSETHDICRIGAIPQFCAINSGVEVDLFGQVNADSVQGRLVAGVGGLPAFVHGALRSPGGRSIVAVPATTQDGLTSRIVPSLGASAATALARHEADYVVTEFGVAALRNATVAERAQRLIGIAAPPFREGLSRAWAEIFKRL